MGAGERGNPARDVGASGGSKAAAWTLAVIVALTALPLFALDPGRAVTQYLLTGWGAAQGLPQGTVTDFARDRQGYLWLGTEEGLVRFDGASFTVFDRSNTPLLPHPMIASLLASPRTGRLWIGTRRGLAWYEGGRFGAFRLEAGLPDERVSCLAEDHAGTLWVGTLGSGLFRFGGGRFEPVSPKLVPGRRVRGLAVDAVGAVWVATETGFVRVAGDRSEVFTRAQGLAGDDGFAVLVDRAGAVWAGSETGLSRRRPDGGWDRFTVRDGLSDDRVRCLLEDRDGNLWVGTQGGGLDRLSGGRFAVLDTGAGLPGHGVESLFEDDEGDLWVGLDGAGLVRLKDGPAVPFGRPEGMPADVVMSVAGTRDGDVWFGTGGGGLVRLVDGRLPFVRAASPLDTGDVTSLAEDGAGRLWVGTYGEGLMRWDHPPLGTPVRVPGLPSDDINALLADRSGGLWVGTGGGGLAHLWDGRTTLYTDKGGLPGSYVQTLIEDREGVLWVGTSEGLARISGGAVTAWTTRDGLPAPSLVAMAQGGDGALWIGTFGDGLIRFADGRFQRLTVRNGLPNDSIYSILQGPGGGIWMSTNRGIVRTTSADLEGALAGRRLRPSVYGLADGLRTVEGFGGTLPCACADSRGRLWFANALGAAMVDPAWRPPPAGVGRTIIEEVRAAGVEPVTEGPARLPSGAHAVEIRYTAPCLSAPERVRFRYRLDGYDEDWIDAGARRVASYPRLPGGRFTFRVEAHASGVAETFAESAIPVEVRPAFYERLWVRALAAVAILALAFAGHRLRVWRLERRRRELESLVDERTGELKKANAELERLAAVDGLTGIANRRTLDEVLARTWMDHRRRSAELSLILCDIDHFKSFNDRCGHPAGDAALRTVAQTLAATCRRGTDLVARYGGEEFAVLLPDTPASAAWAVAHGLLDAVRACRIPHPASSAADHVTLSLGVAGLVPREGLTPVDLTGLADQALYGAKRGGRNRVVLSEG